KLKKDPACASHDGPKRFTIELGIKDKGQLWLLLLRFNGSLLTSHYILHLVHMLSSSQVVSIDHENGDVAKRILFDKFLKAKTEAVGFDAEWCSASTPDVCVASVQISNGHSPKPLPPWYSTRKSSGKHEH